MTRDDLIPYSKNAKIHTPEQVENIAASILNFGFNQPIVIDKNNEIIIGHGRYEACFSLGLQECLEAGYAPKGAKYIPIVKLEDLTDEEVKALRLADNKLNESSWNIELVTAELEDISVEFKKLAGFEIVAIDTEVEDVQEEPKEKAKKMITCPNCSWEFVK